MFDNELFINLLWGGVGGVNVCYISLTSCPTFVIKTGTEIPEGKYEVISNATLSSPEWFPQRPKKGSDVSYYNVSLSVQDKVTRQCPLTNIFEETCEPKRGVEPW